MVPTHPYRAASYNGRVLRCSTACNHIANTWLVVCSTHSAATSKNFGANLDMMAVHAPIVLIPGLPNSARHDVLRRGTRCAPWLLHVLEGVPVVVACAAGMTISGNHAGIKANPQNPRCPGRLHSDFATSLGLSLHPTGTHHITSGPRTRACAKRGPWAMRFSSTSKKKADIADAMSRSASEVLQFLNGVASKLANCGLHSAASFLTAKSQAAFCQSCSEGWLPS